MSITSNIANVASALTTGSLVNNLNADLLDGQTASYFTNLSNTNISSANTWLQANDASTLTASKSYADTSNTNNLIYTNNSISSNVTLLQGINSTQNTRITVIEGVDATQNTNISNLTSWLTSNNSLQANINSTQNTSISNIQGVDLTQNTNISNLTSWLTSNNSLQANINSTQNTRITVIEGVDVTQNTNISNLTSWLSSNNSLQANINSTQNTNITNTFVHANAAFNVANSLLIITNSEDIIWDSATDTYTRSNGLAATQKITNIHSKMRRCVLLDNGSVNYYLDSANSALKADGTAADLTGADGMVMVEITKFYVKYSRTGTLNRWSIAEVPLPGYILDPAFIVDGLEVPARYYGSYDACIWTTGTTYQSGLNYDNNVGAGQNWNTATARLASVSGIYPAVGISRAETRTMAANRGTRWRQLDFHLISAIQLLYLVEYGSFDCQSKIGLGNVMVATSYPASSANQTDSPHSIAGKSNSIGNATGAVDSTTRDTAWMSYRGIENWYGNCMNWVDGFNINSNQGYIAADNNRAFYADDTATNYVQYGSSMINSDGYPTNILALSSGFLPSSIGGSSITYLTDYYNQSTGWRVALVGGFADYGGAGGAFYWRLNHASSTVDRAFGARLVF